MLSSSSCCQILILDAIFFLNYNAGLYPVGYETNILSMMKEMS